MTAVSYITARNHLAATMDSACEDHRPIIVTRDGSGEAVAIMPLAEFESMDRSSRNFEFVAPTLTY